MLFWTETYHMIQVLVGLTFGGLLAICVLILVTPWIYDRLRAWWKSK